MNRVRALLVFLGSIVLAVPTAVFAADMPFLSPGWTLVPEACQACPCGFAGVLAIVQNLMNAGVSVAILFATIIIAWAGFLYIASATNPESRSQANKMLINAAVGMLIVLSAWLMVDFVMKILYEGPDGQQGKFGPWNSILTGGDICVESKKDNLGLFNGSITADGLLAIPTTGTGANPSSSADSGGGTCSPPASQDNPCSVTNMQKGCFASRASDASAVCMRESAGGQVATRSGTDKLDSGTGPSYSWGLWQINLTTTDLTVNGKTLKCTDAFTKKCGKSYGTIVGPSNRAYCTSSIKNQSLYDQCVAAAQNPTTNTSAACQLYNQKGANGGFQPWGYTAIKCSIAKH